ncbi:30S ribosomal protein S4 [Araneus ventricosus]|uniref:30S ribosomal protein S4 n=1 Tax=Araneus ventricosus TaxID=182803 RepID=A0A4Y2AHT0_ARAVE|nr:30S ribosomal protein S4 [Araneus ventricosus]
MTTVITRKYRISRRLGVNLWGRAKDPVNKRKYPPGQHGILGFKKLSDFESRLSSVLYHSSLVPTIYAAKQLISHKHVTVNDKVDNISNYRVKPGDIIKIRERVAKIPVVVEAEQKQERKAPGYLETDSKEHSVKYLRSPQYSEVPYSADMEVNLVVEFYSR